MNDLPPRGQVRCLRPCTREEVHKIREETGDKWKAYRGVISFDAPLTAGDADKLAALEQFDVRFYNAYIMCIYMIF